MTRPLIANISVAALKKNLEVVRSCAANKKIWAVIKANAYGHGLFAASQGFEKADGAALVEWDNIDKLRQLGWKKPILMLEGAFDKSETLFAIQKNISLVVHEWRQIDWIPNETTPLDIYLKLNSGMNRLGFSEKEILNAFNMLRKKVRSITLMTHFANADQKDGTHEPLRIVQSVLEKIAVPYSVANSAAILYAPNNLGDWVRPGIMLYGASPFTQGSAICPYPNKYLEHALPQLFPAMSLVSRLIAVQELKAGESIGYGSCFRAEKPMKIGVVAGGYADGYPRTAPNGTPVSVAGNITSLVGRVSMDMIMVDLTHIPWAKPGTNVELWGNQVSIDTVAQAAGTIGYVLMCSISTRVTIKVNNELQQI